MSFLKIDGESQNRRIDTIVKIKNKLGEYETFCYINNKLLDREVKDFCIKMNNILNDWSYYYRGYNWRETAKAVEDQELYQIAELSNSLKYITLYKLFDSNSNPIMHIDIDNVYELYINKSVFLMIIDYQNLEKKLSF